MTTNTNFKPLIIGQGAIGLAVTNELANQGVEVTGLARGKRSQYQLADNAKYIQANAHQLTAEQINGFTHITIIVTPDNYQAEDYQQTYLGIAEHIAQLAEDLPQLERVVFISSTGVYGQDKGEWIDDTVAPQLPKRDASRYILQAEQALQLAYGERTVIIRPSGIYGKQRLMRVRKAGEDNKEPMPRFAWSNRIMDTDLVTIIVQVLKAQANQLKPLYLATDYAPVTSFELTSWLADKLDSSQPTVLNEGQKGSELVMSGKRLHSNIPREWLQYPDWQTGYTEIMASVRP